MNAFPHGNHGGEVEGRDARHNAQRLPQREQVNPRSGVVGVFAFHQVRDTTGKFHHLKPALNVAARIGDGLTMLRGQELGQAVKLALDELEELEHHTSPALRVRCRPGRLGGRGGCDRAFHLGAGRKRDFGLDLARIGIEHVTEAAGFPGNRLAADEMPDFPHGYSSFLAASAPEFPLRPSPTRTTTCLCRWPDDIRADSERRQRPHGRCHT
jgi:hypothetical protein